MSAGDAGRRRCLALLGALPVLAAAPRAFATRWPAEAARTRFLETLGELERRSGGRLGVCARQVGADRVLFHRGDERFLMCSTFKALLAAQVLHRVDAREERLDRMLEVPAAALVSWSPITEKHPDGRMTIAQLCEATVTVSDNTAANLLLATLGGPAGLTAFLRKVGDDVTRLDRNETALNLPAANRRWDTTTPIAMASSLGTLMFGQVLDEASRRQLRAWTTKTSTGLQRLRAALPTDWPQGDKTGTGPTHTNDVAWFQPPGQAPWIVAAYLADARGEADAQGAILAGVGRAVVALLHDTPETIKVS